MKKIVITIFILGVLILLRTFPFYPDFVKEISSLKKIEINIQERFASSLSNINLEKIKKPKYFLLLESRNLFAKPIGIVINGEEIIKGEKGELTIRLLEKNENKNLSSKDINNSSAFYFEKFYDFGDNIVHMSLHSKIELLIEDIEELLDNYIKN